MSFAKLIVIQPGHSAREFEVVGEVVTIGRALDNTISIEGDTNVSRYHAEISKRGDGFWVSDLGSSNGTTVNDQPVDFEWQLKDGDLISTGGSTIIEFHLSNVPWRRREEPRRQPAARPNIEPQPAPIPSAPAIDATQAAEQTPPVATPPSSGPPLGLILGGVGGGLLLIALVVVVIYLKLTPSCNPTARIVNPQSGTTIREPVTIRVEVANKECIDRLIYELNGQKIESAEFSPYEIVLNPQKYPALAGGNHVLTVTVEDEAGNKILQSEPVYLSFVRADRTPDPVPNTDNAATASLSTSEVKDMVSKLAQRINSKRDYVYDPDFLEQVRSRTGQYVSVGPLERAAAFRDVINEVFVGEHGLPASLAYVTALSRSRFAVENRPSGADAPQGLWQIQPSIAREYLGGCDPSETLSDPNQKCSARVASLYVKRLVIDIFRDDFVYAISTFGMSPGEAAQFRDQLPPDRRDFWKVIKSGPQRDRVVNFFAAGIVGENPQKFNLAQEKALTNLY